MSNQVKIDVLRTEMVNNDKKNVKVFVYDNYDECCFSIEEKDITKNNLDYLKLAIKVMKDEGTLLRLTEDINDMIQFLYDSEKGITINEEYFDFDEIKDILDNMYI